MDNKLINEIISLAENGGARGNDITAVYSRVYIALKKSLGITPYAEQIGAALALTGHNMVQMQTGEGKTFSAVFAACYEALSGGQVMILTFNDYLARRDYEWTKPVYDSMGISIGCITADTPRTDRRKIYSKQVVYLTAKEAGFDYLRDFVCFEPSEMVFPQKLNFAIVDEADSIMIDEARIPLVIAGDIAAEDDGSTAEVYEKTADFTDDDYGIDDDSRNVYLTDAGADKAESVFSCDIYAAENTGLLAKICACLKARVMLQEDKDYILRDGAVILVDEFTGRAAPGRVFPGDLQAAVEAKHGLKLTSRGRIMGNIALQYFLRLFPKLAGMTGTAIQSKEEFDTIYGLPTEVIPTRLPCRRTDHPLEMYFDKTEKRKAVIEAIREAQLKQTIFAVQRYYNKELKVAGILLNKYNPRLTLTKDVEDLANVIAMQLDTKIFKSRISASVSIAEAPAHGESVITYSPKSKAAQEYFAFICELTGEKAGDKS